MLMLPVAPMATRFHSPVMAPRRTGSETLLALPLTPLVTPRPRAVSGDALVFGAMATPRPLPSTTLPTPRNAPSSARSDGVTNLRVSNIFVSGGSFEPSEPHLKCQLIGMLGLSAQAVVKKADGFQGAQNEGVWFVQDHGQDLVLKLVRSVPPLPGMQTEADNLVKMSWSFPTVVSDSTLAFPRHIFRVCRGASREHAYDLVVMQRAPGKALARLIEERCHSANVAGVYAILEKVGACLGDFHKRYERTQHGDFTLANVFVDDANGGRVTFIDFGTMGSGVREGDVEHFLKSLRARAKRLGAEFVSLGEKHFCQGYSSNAGATGPTTPTCIGLQPAEQFIAASGRVLLGRPQHQVTSKWCVGYP